MLDFVLQIEGVLVHRRSSILRSDRRHNISQAAGSNGLIEGFNKATNLSKICNADGFNFLTSFRQNNLILRSKGDITNVRCELHRNACKGFRLGVIKTFQARLLDDKATCCLLFGVLRNNRISHLTGGEASRRSKHIRQELIDLRELGIGTIRINPVDEPRPITAEVHRGRLAFTEITQAQSDVVVKAGVSHRQQTTETLNGLGIPRITEPLQNGPTFQP